MREKYGIAWKEEEKWEFSTPPEPNLEMSFGGKNGGISLCQTVKKTIVNRFRYWMLCKFFPFKIERWEK